MEYSPDMWVVVKLELEEPLFKVFGTWRGGYTTGESWRFNSGIEKVSVDGDYVLFHGYSGSIYRCHKDDYGTSLWSYGVLQDVINNTSVPISVLDEDTDWLTLGEVNA